VGEADLVCERDPVPPPVAERRGGPLADAVEREDRGLLERRREERAGGVGFVVVREDVPAAVVAAQGRVQFVGQVELGFQPEGNGLQVG